MEAVQLEEAELTYDDFLNKLTIIYGETGSGKSRIVKKIMEILHEHIPQISIFSPTDQQNQTYSEDEMVQVPYIHYKITEDNLRLICERQAAHRKKYDKANNIDVMYQLFMRTASVELRRISDKIKSNLVAALAALDANKNLDLESRKSTQTDVTNKTIHLLREFYRREIIDKLKELGRMHLSEAEKYSMRLIRFCPRILIIFDDATEHLKPLNKSVYLQQIFYAGRHNFITTVIACHTDKAFSPELKKQVFVNIFTSPQCASAYFDRSTNNFSKSEKKRADDRIRAAFTQVAPHQKLIWIRLTGNYYRWTARRTRDIKFGAPVVRAFASAITATDENRETSSQFDDF